MYQLWVDNQSNAHREATGSSKFRKTLRAKNKLKLKFEENELEPFEKSISRVKIQQYYKL